MIIYNGASGGLGQFLGPELNGSLIPSHALRARLEDSRGLRAELDELQSNGSVSFIHLAGLVSVPACEADPARAYETNVNLAQTTAENVIAWAARRRVDLRLIYVSTGHVYAAQPDGMKLSEDAETRPRSVYSQTKLAAESALNEVASRANVPILVARVFGLLSPRQAPNYVLPSLIDRARNRDLDEIPGLDFVRDYLDARDVCKDLVLLLSRAWPAESELVNICSGVPTTIRQLLLAVLSELKPKDGFELATAATAGPGRPDDVRWLVGDPERFTVITGEAPQRIPIRVTVTDAISHGGPARTGTIE